MSLPLSASLDELSEEQIDQLLTDAENRMSGQIALKSQRSPLEIPRLHSANSMQPYVKTKDGVSRVESSRIVDPEIKSLADGRVRKVEDPVAVKRKLEELTQEQEKKATAGSQWFDLPRTKLTPELKRDIQLIKMRSVLDPKRFYKQESGKAKPPEYFQIGTVIEGPTEFFSSRLKNKDRNETFTEEVLAQEKDSKRIRRKYAEIQAQKSSGKKGYYKALLAKRRKGRR